MIQMKFDIRESYIMKNIKKLIFILILMQYYTHNFKIDPNEKSTIRLIKLITNRHQQRDDDTRVFKHDF